MILNEQRKGPRYMPIDTERRNVFQRAYARIHGSIAKKRTNPERTVLYGSPEAATIKIVKGWVSRDGLFWGTDEHMARRSGCTHIVCAQCKSVYEVDSYCKPCRDRYMAEQFATFRVEKWDGETPLCLFDSDWYFFGNDVLDWLADHPEEVRICKCYPVYLSTVDDDYWDGDLPEDGALPEAVKTALAALNETIDQAGPSLWCRDDIAIDVVDLRSRMRLRS